VQIVAGPWIGRHGGLSKWGPALRTAWAQQKQRGHKWGQIKKTPIYRGNSLEGQGEHRITSGGRKKESGRGGINLGKVQSQENFRSLK